MEKKKDLMSSSEKPTEGNCNVNSTFNFSIGLLALVVAGILGYVIYHLVAN